MKPVRLPASATLALPRWGLLTLGVLYILPGLINRDPWKSDDAASFGIMWTMAHGGLDDWLWPHIAGLPAPAEGPLAFWFGALCIKLFGWLLGDVLAARISNIGFFLIGAFSVWHGAFRLGCRPEAQPHKLAFGGQPEARDFSRTLADGALLIFLGCFGLWIHTHQTSAEALQVALIAYALYASVHYIETPGTSAALKLGIALGGLAITRGWVVPLGLWLSLLVTFKWLGMETRRLLVDAVAMLGVTLCAAIIWLGSASWLRPFNSTPFDAWMVWNYGQISWPGYDGIKYFLRNGIWFFWPAWPFAGWAVYAWRRQRQALHIVLPLAFMASLTWLALLNPTQEESLLLPLLPSFAILAAFGLPTMKRGAINAIDWFSVMAFTTSAAIIWLFWVAKQTGWPAQFAKNALKLAPGFKPEFDLLAVLIAACGTCAWILLVYWRISRQPSVLWRAVVLSSGGVILCWLLLMTLWLPWGNYVKSYAGVARQITQKLPATIQCVDTNVGPAQRASFAYFGHIPFARFDGKACDFLLLQDSITTMDEDEIAREFRSQHWQQIWEGRRPSDRDERFRLYKRRN